MQIILKLVFALCMVEKFVQADLIGFNRLGNNLMLHQKHRIPVQQKGEEVFFRELQSLMKAMLKEQAEKRTDSAATKNTRRFRQYKRHMTNFITL